MIRYIRRSELDVEKYNACISNAINTRIYAYSWYLDIVATNWDALILDDYNAVMPLSWRSKYFIKYVYPPSWTQQLGVFSSDKIDETLVQKFIKSIPRKFKKVTINFNAGNLIDNANISKRTNYILPLDKTYDVLLNGFNKNRKRALNNIEPEFVVEKNICSNEFLKFYFSTEKKYELLPSQISSLKELVVTKNSAINIWGIKISGELSAGLIWLKDSGRVTYLLPVSTITAKEKGLSPLLINELIKQFSDTDLILDFEGSMIEGVAAFYKSFGAEREEYINFKQYKV